MKKEFAVLVDYRADYSEGKKYSPVLIEAENIIEAMAVAEKQIDETVYLVKVLERKAGIEKADGCRKIKFEEVLVNRGHGWIIADPKHYENQATWNHVVSTSRAYSWEYWEIESVKWS